MIDKGRRIPRRDRRGPTDQIGSKLDIVNIEEYTFAIYAGSEAVVDQARKASGVVTPVTDEDPALTCRGPSQYAIDCASGEMTNVPALPSVYLSSAVMKASNSASAIGTMCLSSG